MAMVAVSIHRLDSSVELDSLRRVSSFPQVTFDSCNRLLMAPLRKESKIASTGYFGELVLVRELCSSDELPIGRVYTSASGRNSRNLSFHHLLWMEQSVEIDSSIPINRLAT